MKTNREEEIKKLQFLMQEYQTHGLRIPQHMLYPLTQYLVYHAPVGDFLKAVLCNDLTEASMRADDMNIHALSAYVGFLHNHIDGAVWGSLERYGKWTEQHREIMQEER